MKRASLAQALAVGGMLSFAAGTADKDSENKIGDTVTFMRSFEEIAEPRSQTRRNIDTALELGGFVALIAGVALSRSNRDEKDVE